MWSLVRALALVTVALVVALLGGAGPAIVDGVQRFTGAADAAWLLGPEPATSTSLWVGAAVGAAAALLRPTAAAIRQLVTLLHELGHTLVAAAAGARPAGVVLRHDASGHATARWVGDAGPGRRVVLAAVAVVGLPSPVAATAAGAAALVLFGPEPVLWATAAAGVLVAVLARSAWSFAVALACAGLALAALRDAVAGWATAIVVALLVAVAVRATVDAARRVGRPIAAEDDARAVTAQLRLPARAVLVAQVAVTVLLALRTAVALAPLA